MPAITRDDMKRTALLLAAGLIATSAIAADAQTRSTLDITSSTSKAKLHAVRVSIGESVLIDTETSSSSAGPPRASWRLWKDARLTQIDHLITTHWHGDHFGGMAELRCANPDQGIHRSRTQAWNPSPRG